jgi:hypothetical protein
MEMSSAAYGSASTAAGVTKLICTPRPAPSFARCLENMDMWAWTPRRAQRLVKTGGAPRLVVGFLESHPFKTLRDLSYSSASISPRANRPRNISSAGFVRDCWATKTLKIRCRASGRSRNTIHTNKAAIATQKMMKNPQAILVPFPLAAVRYQVAYSSHTRPYSIGSCPACASSFGPATLLSASCRA